MAQALFHDVRAPEADFIAPHRGIPDTPAAGCAIIKIDAPIASDFSRTRKRQVDKNAGMNFKEEADKSTIKSIDKYNLIAIIGLTTS